MLDLHVLAVVRFFDVPTLAPAPAMLEGTDITGFYTASGYTFFAGEAAMSIWFFVASVSMVVASLRQ